MLHTNLVRAPSRIAVAVLLGGTLLNPAGAADSHIIKGRTAAPVGADPAGAPVRTADPGTFAADATDLPDEPGDGAGDEDLPPFPTDLMGLIGSLATQATMLLAGDPATRRPPAPPEMEAVRSIIALLDVLHEKTANNRSPQEERVLDAVRYELKMAYVARTRAGGA